MDMRASRQRLVLATVLVVIAAAAVASPAFAAANAVIPTSSAPGESLNTINNYVSVPFPANDDGTWPCGGLGPACPGPEGQEGPEAYPLGFSINFFGTRYSSAYVNNNGNITFSASFSQYTPETLTTFGSPIIAPFFADVDTRARESSIVNFGRGTLNGLKVFVVNWPAVGCFNEVSSVLNTFQLVLVDRPERHSGETGDDFDIEFNYNTVQWDTGQASNGDARCQDSSVPGDSAYAGYTNGTFAEGASFDLPGSGVTNALLDSSSSTGLIYHDLNSNTLGRYLFAVVNGQPPTATALATSLVGGTQSSEKITVPEGTAVSDSATLSGTHAATATGTVSYKVYSDEACTKLVSDAGTASVTGGVVPTSEAQTLAPGTYYWQAAYSGDSSNNSSLSPCGSETETVTVSEGAAGTVTNVDPNRGPEAGGTPVIITGTNLSAATAVKFGSTSATSFTVNSATSIATVSPAGAGTVDVTVATPGSTTATSTADQFRYVPPPIVTNLKPAKGPEVGGTSVTITGTNLSDATAVKFGSTGATGFVAHSSTSVTAISPAGTGTVHVTVTTPGGTSLTSAADRFTYLPAPTVTSLNPNNGPTDGGTDVTVTGTGFGVGTAATSFKFGSTLATSVNCVSATTCTAVSPAHQAGTVPVRATVDGLTSADAPPADDFTYVAPSGAVAWGYNGFGQLGDGLTETSAVPVAVSKLRGIKEVSASGYHSLALLDNGTVMAWGGNYFGQLGNGKRGEVSTVPVHVCAVGAIGPCPTGPYLSEVGSISAGGVWELALLRNGTVVAWGSNENGQLGNGTVSFGSSVPVAVSGLTGVTSISAGDENSLALLGNGTAVAWGENRVGQLGDGTINAYSDVPVAVSGLSGVASVSAGGFHGEALLSNGRVMAWGGNHYGQLGNGKSGEISDVPVPVCATGAAGPCPTGPYLSEVTAISDGGAWELALLGNGTVTAWGDNEYGQLGNGTNSFGSSVPVAVSGLSGVTHLSAGGEHSLAVLSNGTAVGWGYGGYGELGNGSETGVNDIPTKVSWLSGVTSISAGEYHSVASFSPSSTPSPSVTNVSPSTGAAAGGSTVTITGTNFTGATAVKFGTANATSFVVNSSISVTAIAPPGKGTADVSVTTPQGTSRASSADRYSYVSPPVVGRVMPRTGSAAGGTTVTISGTNLAGATAVEFGPTSAASFTVNSGTSITAVSPAEMEGRVDVTVTTAYGTSAIRLTDRFKFTPTVASVTPNIGPTGGGTSVTVSGTGFGVGTSATKIRFGTKSGTSVNCTSTTTCTVLAPAHKAGPVDVRATVNEVVSPTNPPADQFTYT